MLTNINSSAIITFDNSGHGFFISKSKDTDWAWKTLTVSLLSARFVSFLLEVVMPVIYKKNCNNCGKYYKGRGKKFCSCKCSGKNKIGIKLSETTKKKMSKRQLGSKNCQWKGGKTKHSKGYILILNPKHPFSDKKGYILEHRLVMEKMLGRYLTPEETLHHINGIKNDNRPENLRLFPNHSFHMKFHHLSRNGMPTLQWQTNNRR